MSGRKRGEALELVREIVCAREPGNVTRVRLDCGGGASGAFELLEHGRVLGSRRGVV
jgi:hypothetical protein